MRHRIYVPLARNPGALLEVDAVPAGDARFRLAGRLAPGEHAQFRRGEIVECEIRALPDGKKALVAFRSVSSDPEFRKRRNMFAVCGALIGGILGAAIALCFETTSTAAVVGFLLGSVSFAYCSARWGDGAWDVLVQFFPWDSWRDD